MSAAALCLLLLLLCLCGAFAAAAAAPPAAAAEAEDAVRVRRDAGGVTAETARLRLRWDLATGLWEARWPSGATLRGAACAAKLADGTALRVADYPRHESGPGDAKPIRDAFGAGVEVTVRHAGGPTGRAGLRQRFRVYPDQPYVLVRLEVVGDAGAPLAANEVTPLLVDGDGAPGAGLRLPPGAAARPRTLFVPYDNDEWVRYNSDHATESYEVTAVYDNATRNGFVVGAVTHDVWKTGLRMGGGADDAPGALPRLRVYGGATGRWTRDTQPHGAVSGETVASEQVLVGYFSDWRDGLEAYGDANGRLRPPLAWDGPAPFGWNSWSAHKEKLSFDHFAAASDFLKKTLTPGGFADADGGVYVNLDSYWDNLSDEQLADTVRRARAAGQRAGIYWTPFVCWGGDLDRPVEGTGGRWRYRDILLKDPKGEPLPKLDGGIPIDPTHPGSLARTDAVLGRFVALGFDFVKLDFLTHGSLEGAHFDPAVPTGTAAYHVGMKRVLAALSPGKAGRPIFVSLSIAPLFPAGYGHARRISCDAAGGVGATEYLLNSLTYGWWAQGGVYHLNDPDHTVLYQEGGQRVVTEDEARSRLNASVISGAMVLVSDDWTDPAARDRAARLLRGHPEVFAVARSGGPFRPVEGDTGSRAADTFVRAGKAPAGDVTVALFNHDAEKRRAGALDLARLGLDPAADYDVRDLWTGRVTRARGGTLPVDLPAAASALLRLTPAR